MALLLIGGTPAAQDSGPGLAYVVNTQGNSVSIIDTETNAVTFNVPVGLRPTQVAVSRDGARAYVINADSLSVSVIDAATQTVSAIVALGESPSSVAVSPSGDRLYVLTAGGVLRVIDTAHLDDPAANPFVASVAVGTSGKIAVTPDGKRIYVAGGTIAVIDAETNTLVAANAPQLPGGDVQYSANNVNISPDGTRAYVSLISYSMGPFGFEVGGAIAVVHVDTNAITTIIPIYSQAASVVFNADGSRAFVSIESFWANTGYGAAFLPGHWVASINTDTEAIEQWIDLGPAGEAFKPHTPRGIAVTTGNNVGYAAVPSFDLVAVFDTTTGAIHQLIPVAGGPSAIGIAPPAPVPPRALLVDALDDAAPAAITAGSVAIENVLANDRIGGSAATRDQVTLAKISATSDAIALNADSGAVWIGPEITAGSHSLSYRICEASNAGNCDDATVAFTVRARYVVTASDDSVSGVAGSNAGNVLGNDTLDDGPATLEYLALSLVSADGGLGLAGDGSVIVADSTAAGEHGLVYRLCERASPDNCDDGAVRVTVTLPALSAAADKGRISRNGGTAIANVLANDTLGGASATMAGVTLASVSSTDEGVSLNAATGAIAVTRGTPAGVHTLVYRACEIVRPENCSEANAEVTVDPFVIVAANDSARVSNKTATMRAVNVLANDSLGGVRATSSTVSTSLVSLSPSNNQIRLNADGTIDILGKSGGSTYTLTYQICEVGSPANCARARVTLEFSGKN
jgi:YVTN family beta-propeller protein